MKLALLILVGLIFLHPPGIPPIAVMPADRMKAPVFMIPNLTGPRRRKL